MPPDPQLTVACEKLRTALLELLYLPYGDGGVPLRNPDGSFVSDGNGWILYDESATQRRSAPTTAEFYNSAADRAIAAAVAAMAPKRVRGSAAGPGALRIVLQHALQADHDALCERPDAPGTCFVVQCEERTRLRCVDTAYAPALTSYDCALRLVRDMAQEYAGDDYEIEDLRDDHATCYLRKITDSNQYVTFYATNCFPMGDLDGTLEDAETFLDLRSLAALRVVVGPDKSLSKMFGKVVALRETKSPRAVFADFDRSNFYGDSRDLHVYKGTAQAKKALEDLKLECGYHPIEVMKLAAELDARHAALGPERWAQSGYDRIPSDLREFVDLARVTPFDATYVHYNGFTDEPLPDGLPTVRIAIRPLPLADEADAVVAWAEDVGLLRGVRTLTQEAARNLNARG